MSERFNLNRPIEDFILELPPVGIGVDSIVFKYHNSVIKKYPDAGMDKLNLYKQVTNKASSQFNGKKYETIYGVYQFKIVPISRLLKGSGNLVYAISDYIDGANLEQLITKRDISPTKASVIMRTCQSFRDIINSDLSVHGINIIPLNIKVKNSQEIYDVYVTDLCPRLRDLRT